MGDRTAKNTAGDAPTHKKSRTGNAAQQNSSSSNANYTAPSNGGGLKEANFNECIPTILSPECTLRRKSEALNRVIELAQKSGGLDLVALYKFASLSEIVKTIRFLMCQHSNTLTILSLKFLTLIAHQTKLVVPEIARKHVDHFIARCIELESTTSDPSPVRAAAFALVMAMITSYKPDEDIHAVVQEPLPMPPSIIESLREVAVDHVIQDDPYSRVALDALAQIAVRNPALAARAQVFTVLIEAIVDPYFKAMQEALIISILYLMNDTSTRKYLYNVEYILAPLNGGHCAGGVESLQLSIRALTIMLKSWPGLIWACKTGGMQSLVSAIRHKDPAVSSLVLDAFFEVFRIPHPGTTNPFQRQEVVLLESDPGDSLLTQTLSDDQYSHKKHRHNLITNYVAILLVCFTEVGLFEALIELVNHTEERTKVTVLLAELLYLSNTLVPKETCARLQQAPTLLKKAVSFELDAHLRSRASTMITNLHKYTNLKASDAQSSRKYAMNSQKVEDRRLGRVDEVKKKIDWEMDESTLSSKLRQTQVQSFPLSEWTKWKFEFITELLDGPLRNPTLLAVALKTKFFKRVLNFFSPNKKLFSELPWSYENLLYVRAGCQVIELLTETEIGKAYLQDHLLIKQTADLLNSEITKIAAKDKDLFWSHDRMLKTMAREYFTMLGVLSRSDRGLAIMRKYDMFKTLRTLCEESGRDDIVNLILTSLDYEHHSECHSILEVVLNSKSPVMRYLATRHMRQLLRYRVSDFHLWGIDLVRDRVGDTDAKVRALALEILDEAVDDELSMGRLISAKPALGNISGLGRALQIRFLSTKAGLRFLKEIDFIVPEMEKWIESENIVYVDQLERKLASVLNRSLNRRVNTQDTAFTHSFSAEDETYVPPHFFGELSKTMEGCKLLKKSNAINKFIKAIKSPKYSLLERRSAIWALGHVASNETGWTFLQPLNVAQLLADLVNSPTDLCTKGTCFYVLGMMSTLPQVRQVLSELGWDFPEHKAARIALPASVRDAPLFSLLEYPSSFIRANNVTLPDVQYQNGRGYVKIPIDPSDARGEALQLCQNLSNSVARDQTWRGLRRLRSKNPELFADPLLLFEVWKLFENFSFRLSPRRQLADYFAETTFTEEVFDQIDQIWPVH